MTDSPLPPLTPAFYGEASHREPHVKVVERWADCANFPPDHPERTIEFLHRQMNEETNVLENAASSLAEFPDAPWEIRYWLARQCSDEARHLIIYLRLVRQHGCEVGKYPVMNFQYRILRKVDTLIGRLAVQNRTFEAEGLDAVTHAYNNAVDRGEDDLVAVYDAQQADEILHIGFANRWIKEQIAEDPRNVMHIARALTLGSKAFEEVFAGGGTSVTGYGVAESERKLAGFDDDEVAIASKMSEERRSTIENTVRRSP